MAHNGCRERKRLGLGGSSSRREGNYPASHRVNAESVVYKDRSGQGAGLGTFTQSFAANLLLNHSFSGL